MTIDSFSQLRAVLQTHTPVASSDPTCYEGPTVPNNDGMACWNFALAGGSLDPSHGHAPMNIVSTDGPFDQPKDKILILGFQPDVHVADINPKFIETNGAYDRESMEAIRAAVNSIPEEKRSGHVWHDSNLLATCLLKIIAKRNQLEISADDTYQLHMTGSTWFGWSHFALSVKVRRSERDSCHQRIYIQTVPDRPINYATSDIWDKKAITVSINIAEPPQRLLSLLENISYGGRCAGRFGVGEEGTCTVSRASKARCLNERCAAHFCKPCWESNSQLEKKCPACSGAMRVTGT